jgi:hypothetical protein
MPDYRFYKIAKDGHIAGPPAAQDLPNDSAALEEAKRQVDGHAIEIWQGARIVAHLDPTE